MTNHPPSVLRHCWLGHQTCKNRRPYNLYCVGADVKPCSINQSIGIHTLRGGRGRGRAMRSGRVASVWIEFCRRALLYLNYVINVNYRLRCVRHTNDLTCYDIEHSQQCVVYTVYADHYPTEL